MPTTSTISLYRGEDRNFYFNVDPPEDITGFLFEFNAARQKNMGSKLLKIPCVVTDGPNGIFRVSITEAQTDPIQPGSYFWDTWEVNPGNRRICGIGTFQVKASVREPNS
jgi:hypothetical protein